MSVINKIHDKYEEFETYINNIPDKELREAIFELVEEYPETKEESLDWEIVMETFWRLRSKMNPWEFEKLIINKYE